MPKKKKVTTGNVIAKKKKKCQRCYPGKREERKKKCNLNWGYLCKVHLLALFSPHFSPKLGGYKKVGLEGKFPPYFLSLLFSLLNQTVKNVIFHPIFLFLFSILLVFTQTKHTLKDVFFYFLFFYFFNFINLNLIHWLQLHNVRYCTWSQSLDWWWIKL